MIFWHTSYRRIISTLQKYSIDSDIFFVTLSTFSSYWYVLHHVFHVFHYLSNVNKKGWVVLSRSCLIYRRMSNYVFKKKLICEKLVYFRILFLSIYIYCPVCCIIVMLCVSVFPSEGRFYISETQP